MFSSTSFIFAFPIWIWDLSGVDFGVLGECWYRRISVVDT